MQYYQKIQYIARVDQNDKILMPVEKWETHKKGILHRGFTVILTYQNKIILQKRKHPVFDSVYDTSFSSHQLFISNALQDDITAVEEALQREWIIEKGTIVGKPKFLYSFYYKAKDPKSEYIEHEIDHLYSLELLQLPKPVLDYAYESICVSLSDLKQKNSKIFLSLAPWSKTIIQSAQAGRSF